MQTTRSRTVPRIPDLLLHGPKQDPVSHQNHPEPVAVKSESSLSLPHTIPRPFHFDGFSFYYFPGPHPLLYPLQNSPLLLITFTMFKLARSTPIASAFRAATVSPSEFALLPLLSSPPATMKMCLLTQFL